MELRLSRTPVHLAYYRMAGYVVTILMHAVNTYVMLTSFRGDVLKDPNIQQFATLQDKFITCWNFTAQSGHAALGLLCDVLGVLMRDQREHRLLSYLRQMRNILFASIVVPFSFTIPTCFWPIFLYNRELILPGFTTKIVGSLSNHVMHTAIIPATLWEMSFQPRRPPKSHKQNISLMFAFTVIYLVIVFITFSDKGYFPYPLMTMLYGSVYFVIVMALVLVWLPIYYYGQWHVNRLLWADTTKEKKQI